MLSKRVLLLALLLTGSLQGAILTMQPLYKALMQSALPLTPQILVINVETQRLSLYEMGELVKEYRVSTAKNGTGSASGSYCTPLGLHKIAQKFGAKTPLYTIFESRLATGKLWKPGSTEKGDLILTRILWLEGLQAGQNRGVNSKGQLVDSGKRFIYIHGTNHEQSLGTPVSRGCIRMSNRDVSDLFERVSPGALVWICSE